MLNRLIILALLLGASYWYWSGPYQARTNPSYAQKLEANDEAMRLCIRTANYKSGATGVGTGDPETQCAQKHRVYFKDGHWHSYEDARPGE